MKELEMSVLAFLLLCLVAGVLSEDDPLGTAEDYLKYDIKKGASLRPDYEAVGGMGAVQGVSGIQAILKIKGDVWIMTGLNEY